MFRRIEQEEFHVDDSENLNQAYRHKPGRADDVSPSIRAIASSSPIIRQHDYRHAASCILCRFGSPSFMIS